MKAGNHAAACPKLAESLRLDPSSGTLLNLGICEEAIGKLATASARYQQLVDTLPATDDRGKLARERLEAVAPRVPRLRIVLGAGVSSDTRVQLDGVELRGASLGTWLPLDVGDHTVVVGSPPTERRVRVSLAEKQRHVHTVEAVAPAPPGVVAPAPVSSASAKPEPAPRRGRTAGWVALGAGAAGIGVSLLAGGFVLQENGRVADHCRASKCDPDGLDAGKRGSRWVTVANVAFAVGVVGLAAGSYLLLRAEPGGAAIAYTGVLP